MTALKTPKFYRQRFLLLLLEMAGGCLSKMDFQKLLFLSQKEAGFSYYDFVPYHYGCYSFQAQSDIELLGSLGWLEENSKSINLLAKPGDCLKSGELDVINQFTKQFKEYRGRKLVTYVYERYPYYATRSKIATEILDEISYRKVSAERNKLIGKDKVIYTIGYEGLSFESYVNQLLKSDVRLLCDVRKNPLSRKFGFSKGVLSRLLPKLGVNYLHIPDLGIRSDMRQELNSEEDYKKLFRAYVRTLPQKMGSLQLLKSLLNEHQRIALTCYEKEHHSCHRHCVTDYLENKSNIRVRHI
ncbi:MAG: DUF488 domain-containing protein [Gammaproteobacteria bacterium]|nr:DUF488 domain-containing protein [Gammaproteobacteria bacterium]